LERIRKLEWAEISSSEALLKLVGRLGNLRYSSARKSLWPMRRLGGSMRLHRLISELGWDLALPLNASAGSSGIFSYGSLSCSISSIVPARFLAQQLFLMTRRTVDLNLPLSRIVKGAASACLRESQECSRSRNL